MKFNNDEWNSLKMNKIQYLWMKFNHDEWNSIMMAEIQ